MDHRENMWHFFLFQFLYAGIFLCAASLNLSGFLGISRMTLRHMIVLFAALIVLLLFQTADKRMRLQLAGVFGLILLLGIFLGSILNWLPSFWTVLGLSLGMGNGSDGEILYAEYVRMIFVALAGCFFYLLMKKYFALKIGAAAVLTCLLAGTLFWGWQGSKAGTAFTMLFIVVVLGDWMRLRWEKVKGGKAYKFMLGIMPFLAVYWCILLVLPVIEKPYDWQWAKELYQKTSERLSGYTENLFHTGREDMDLAMSGFSEKGDLTGSIQSENRALMKIEVKYGVERALYLTGRIFDSFDGRRWQSKSGEGQKQDPRLMDVLEMSYGLSRYAEDDNWRYLKNSSMEMTYQYFHTDYLLAPSKCWEIREGNLSHFAEEENLLFDRNAGFGTNYFLNFYQLSMNREEFLDFLQWDGEESKETWRRVVRQYTQDDISMEDLYAYRESMKKKYAQKSEISPGVQEWILQHTEGAATPEERLQRIEDALSAMEYNKNPGALPDQVADGKSFLDYFLLESQKGYCTYYATAFVLLARAEGFPARYVQGFCVPAGKGGEMEVYSGMAHAWPEVYLEGKGWIPFEPTPGYGSYYYSTQGTKEGEGILRQTVTEMPREPETELLEEAPDLLEEEQTVWEIGRWIAFLCAGLLIVLLCCILLLIMDYLWKKRCEKRWDLRKRYQAAVLYNLQILEMLGIKRKETETWQEMRERMEGIPITFIEIYENVIYGSRIVDEDILDQTWKEKEKLLELLKQKKGKAYWIYWVRLYMKPSVI